MPFKTHNWALRTFNFTHEDYLEYIWKNPVFFHAAQAYSAYSHKVKNKRINYKSRSKIKTLGIKDFSINTQKFKLEDYLINQNDLKVIHLNRDNLLKRLVSAMLMTRVGVSVTNDNSDKNVNMDINLENLLKGLKRDTALNEYETMLVKKLERRHPVFKLSYEEYFDSADSINKYNKAIFEFLDVEPMSQVSDQQKILSNSLKDVVGNYRELENVLRGSPYEKYLN